MFYFNPIPSDKRRNRMMQGLCQGCGKQPLYCSCKNKRWPRNENLTERAILRFYDEFAENKDKKPDWNTVNDIRLILNRK